jgi:beta-lactam-binding protein with PASTA domain
LLVKRIGALLASLALLAGPTSAVAHADTEAQQAWPMPDVRGMTVEQATQAIKAVTGNKKQKIQTQDIRGWGRAVLSPSMWDVCRQSPGAGRPITKKRTIALLVTRHGDSCKVK